MGRIDADKLIECMKEYFEGRKIKTNPCAPINMLIDDICKGVVREIEAQPIVGEWIPVSKRPPQRDGKYLCWCGTPSSEHKWGYKKILGFTTEPLTEGFTVVEGFYEIDPEWVVPVGVNSVFAWMELPPDYISEIEK